jgi:hypothetical protein
VPDDADADVMKVIVRKRCNVPLLFRQRVAFIAATLGVEKLPAALPESSMAFRSPAMK